MVSAVPSSPDCTTKASSPAARHKRNRGSRRPRPKREVIALDGNKMGVERYVIKRDSWSGGRLRPPAKRQLEQEARPRSIKAPDEGVRGSMIWICAGNV